MNVRRIRRTAVAALASLAMGGTAVASPALAAPALGAPALGASAVAAPDPGRPTATAKDACPQQPGPFARCLTRYRSVTTAGRAITANLAEVAGWGATDIAAAYRLPTTSATPLIAVSIAYDAPYLEDDLNFYRQQYGLPPCTSADGCFRKVNQDGLDGPWPNVNFGWQIEATLDVSMISAACPSCRILVVEANSNAFVNLAATEASAVRLGAQVVSNSYGGRESGQAMRYAAQYRQPGHTLVVSSGDSGFTAASFPAALDTVVAVGGTTLQRADNDRGFTESVWPLAGSGCSAYVAKPAWQHDTHCPMRTVADVAAVADDIALFNAMAGGWLTVSGTSASAPIVAGIYGLAGHAGTTGAAQLYQHPGGLFDVLLGANDSTGTGSKCGGDYLCTGQPGYDAPTGLGTPNGIAAF